VPLGADLLGQAMTAEARLIDAEHDAQVARAEFDRAVRRLQLAGASVDEIAGPGVYICNECLGLCDEIISGELGGSTRQDHAGR
jgi:hypothetical protein